MEAARTRLGGLLEWIAAAACIVATLGIGSIVVREFRTVSAVMPLSARETAPAPVPPVPAGVPSRAVSVPVLLLPDGKEVRVGETLSAVMSRFDADPQPQPASLERSPNGERVTRFYDHRGTRFVLVFEPFERAAEPRVAAIFLP